MRRTKRTTFVAALVAALSMLIASVAFADNLQNDTTDTVETNAGRDVVITAGDSGATVKYWVQDTGNNGCDIVSSTVTINVTGATATPSSFTLTGCGTAATNNQSVVLTGANAGTFSVTASATPTFVAGTGRSLNPNAGNFSLIVQSAAPSDTTAPVLDLPDDITTEATSAGGANVEYIASAEDAVDGDVTPSCLPASGLTYALGTTEVECTATDAAGNTSTGTFNITVVDTKAPTLDLPEDITTEATSPDGATVNYEASADDTVDGDVTPSCLPASGLTYALGTTEVECTATDAAGNTSTGTFNITVVDTKAPTLDLPEDITTEATSPDGATVNYEASADDTVDGDVTPSCLPASGLTYALGTTEVECTATDAAGNTSTGTFNITVIDTTAPVLGTLTNMSRTATGPSGATVTYSVPTATDAVDATPEVDCNPASGSTFALGSTTVTCTATDATGNERIGTFTVTVSYNFTGFFRPVDNNGVLNSVKAGSAVPIKFTLGGNMGSSIMEAGHPKSQVIGCDDGALVDPVESTVTAGQSSLSYDIVTGQYTYVWKTEKVWTGCRQLTVKFIDGTTKTALFKLTK